MSIGFEVPAALPGQEVDIRLPLGQETSLTRLCVGQNPGPHAPRSPPVVCDSMKPCLETYLRLAVVALLSCSSLFSPICR